jgi:hypothetical protein
MRYKIVSNGIVIAAFLCRGDRDLCVPTFQEAYDDCTFGTVDEPLKVLDKQNPLPLDRGKGVRG